MTPFQSGAVRLQFTLNLKLLRLIPQHLPSSLRPHSSPSITDTPHDFDICSTATQAIARIFEDLGERDTLRSLGLATVNALVSVEMRFSNPVLAAAAVGWEGMLVGLKGLVG